MCILSKEMSYLQCQEISQQEFLLLVHVLTNGIGNIKIFLYLRELFTKGGFVKFGPGLAISLSLDKITILISFFNSCRFEFS